MSFREQTTRLINLPSQARQFFYPWRPLQPWQRGDLPLNGALRSTSLEEPILGNSAALGSGLLYRKRMSLQTSLRRSLSRIYTSRVTRKFFESLGVHVIPANFYSGFPTLLDIEKSWERENQNPYLNSFSNNIDDVRNELSSLAEFTRDFDFPLSDSGENPRFVFLPEQSIFPFGRTALLRYDPKT